MPIDFKVAEGPAKVDCIGAHSAASDGAFSAERGRALRESQTWRSTQRKTLNKAFLASASLLLVTALACGSEGDSVSTPGQDSVVLLEVPEGTGPIPKSAASKEECTTSCSLANHKIPPFSERDFERARLAYSQGQAEAESNALDSLLFYGPRTLRLLEELGYGKLSSAHKSFLDRELSRKNAEVSLRLVDEDDGSVRALYGPSLVPIGKKQHLDTVGEGLLAMQFNGTVMRTGVNYLWARY